MTDTATRLIVGHTTKRPRQVVVTHISTGFRTVVRSFERKYYSYSCGVWWKADLASAARQLGYRFPADCTARVVPAGEEYRLAFDVIPLVLRSRP